MAACGETASGPAKDDGKPDAAATADIADLADAAADVGDDTAAGSDAKADGSGDAGDAGAGADAPGDGAAGTDAADPDGTAGDTPGPDSGDGQDAAADGTDTACPGGVGCSCKQAADCASAACVVWSNGTKQCAKPCAADGDCAKGEVCDGASGASVCLPKAIAVCAPCLGNAECQVAAPGGACVDGGPAGAYCGSACSSDADCPSAAASVCADVKDIEGKATKQCVPKSGSTCGCSDYAIAKFAKTLCFTEGQPGCAATRQCLPAGATGAPAGGGLSACAPQPASAEVCDGLDNDCDGATDEGGPALCDDSQVCTQDACGAGKGCDHVPTAGPCNDDNACTDKDGCAVGLCAGVSVSCDDGDACTADTCDPLKGCQYAPISASDTLLAPCSDNNACTEKDACKDGKCAGTKLSCDDGNPCTADACDLASGCTATANTAKCSDNDACTSGDSCVGGSCVGAAIDCDDKNVCTSDSCEPAKGCQHLFAKGGCDDGNACTLNDACVNGDCTGTLLDELKGKGCEDDNPCTDVACDLAVGCTLVDNTKACDDGDACTSKDTCKAGKCAGAALGCDDDNPCTDDSCDAAKGCAHSANTASCDDGDPCTADACASPDGTCTHKAIPNCAIGCTQDAQCQGNCQTGVCNAVTGQCVMSNKDDGIACPTGDACQSSVCKSGACTTPAYATDGTVCASGQVCASGACSAVTQGWAKAIAAGLNNRTMCAIAHAGSVYCWGANAGGSAGTGNTAPQNSPVQVAGVSGAVKVSVGNNYACALLDSAKVRCWGTNDFGQMGTGGVVGSAVLKATDAPLFDGARDIACSDLAACIVAANGLVSCVGYNGYYLLGDGTYNDRATLAPTKGIGGSGTLTATAVFSGTYGFCAQHASGIACWGWDGQGALTAPNGSGYVTVPTANPLFKSADHFALTSYTALFSSGSAAYGTGTPSAGEFGAAYGTTDNDKANLLAVSNPFAFAGSNSTLYLLQTSGKLWASGKNEFGNLGLGASAAKTVGELTAVTVQVPSTAVAAAPDVACLLGTDGQVRCAGYGAQGTLGTGGTANSSTFELVKAP